MNFFQALSSYFRNAFNFKGRASRSEFWYASLAYFIVGITTLFILPNDTGIHVARILQLIFFIPNLSLAVRRIHDTNHSGWWYLVPFFSFYLMFVEGDPFDNKFGDNPLDTY